MCRVYYRNYSTISTVMVLTLIDCVSFTVAWLAVVRMTSPVSYVRGLTRCVDAGRRCHGESVTVALHQSGLMETQTAVVIWHGVLTLVDLKHFSLN